MNSRASKPTASSLSGLTLLESPRRSLTDLSEARRQATEFLIKHDQAALFAGMGLGKTRCCVNALQTLQVLHGTARRTLVVAPLRVARMAWPNELTEWAPHLRWAIYRGKRVDFTTAEVWLTNYEQLPNLRRALDRTMPFDLVIFDELTAAKNHNSVRINCIRKRLPARRWGLTGTPTPNSLMEIFAQVRLLDGGRRLGPSFDNFRRTYFEPIDYMEYNWKLKPGADKLIYDKIHDLALSLPTAQQFQLHDHEIPLPGEARDIYEQLSSELLAELGDAENPVIAQNMATLVIKLLQLTGGHLYRKDRAIVAVHTAKLDALDRLAHMHRAAGRPLLVSTAYLHERDAILRRLPWAQTLKGKDWLERWNARKIPLLVAHPRSLGHGLNLQYGGHDIVWYSVPHSRELYDQLNGRLDRTGQDRVVQIHRLLCRNTIDEAVVETLRQRGHGQRELLDTLVNYRRLRS